MLLAVLAATTLATPSSAQIAGPQPVLTLLGLSGTVGPGSRPADLEVADDEIPDDVTVRVAVTVDTDVTDLRLTVELHPAVGLRSVLHAALDDGDVPTRALTTTETTIEDPPVDTTLGVGLTIADEDIPWPDDPGIFPLVVSAFDGSTFLDTIVTAVVWLPRPVTPTLQTVAVVPLHGGNTLGVQGRPSADPYPVTDPDGPLRTILAALQERPDLAVAVRPDVPVIEELEARAGGWTTTAGEVVTADDPRATAAATTLDQFRTVLTTSPIDPVLGSYAGADLAALVAAEDSPSVVELAAEAVTTARTRLQALVGRAPDLGTHVADTTTTPAVLDVVRDQRVILPYDLTRGPPADNEPALADAFSLTVSLGGRELPVLLTDPHVDAVLTDTDTVEGVPAQAQRLLAEVASLWLEAPNRQRLLTILPPDDWAPSPRLLGAWLDTLDAAPWLALTSARDAVQTVGRSTNVPQLAASTSRMPSNLQAQFARSLQLLDALETASGDLVQTETQQVLPRLRDAILRATADAVSNPDAAAAVLDQVADVIDMGFGTLQISAPNTTLDGTGELPVTLSRTDGGDINVVVRIESAGRLTWEGQGQRQNVQLPAGGTRTVSFETRALSRGTFPVSVTVLDPTETRVLATTDLTVRNTALNVVVLVAIVVLVVGLLVAGRRRRRPGLELVADKS